MTVVWFPHKSYTISMGMLVLNHVKCVALHLYVHLSSLRLGSDASGCISLIRACASLTIVSPVSALGNWSTRFFSSLGSWGSASTKMGARSPCSLVARRR